MKIFDFDLFCFSPLCHPQTRGSPPPPKMDKMDQDYPACTEQSAQVSAQVHSPPVLKWLERLLHDISPESLTAPPMSSIGDLVLTLRIIDIKLLPHHEHGALGLPSYPSFPEARLEWAKLHVMAQYSKKYYEKMQQRLSKFDKQNRCVLCLTDLGYDNPRQLCSKTHCQWQ